jgi:hypothetical protein
MVCAVGVLLAPHFLSAQSIDIAVPVSSQNAFIVVRDMDLTLEGSAALPGNGTWKFTGSMPIAIENGVGESLTFPNVELRSATGIELEGGDMYVNRSFEFVLGLVETNGNRLVFGPTAEAIGARNASYVNGTVAKSGSADFIFPVGNGGVYQPISIGDLSGANAVFEASYSASGHPDPQGPWYNGVNWPISTCDYWSINRTSGSDEASVGLSWGSNACNEVNDASYLALARYADGLWEMPLAAPADPLLETIGTATPVAQFGDFALASTGGGINVLPITLLHFDASHIENGQVACTWSTASETNNAFFTLERSIDAQSWNALTEIAGAGNSNTVLNYVHFDHEPHTGQSYYRLKQTDYDGQYSYSETKSIYIEAQPFSLQLLKVFRNGDILEMAYNANEPKVQFAIFDMLGKQVFQAHSNAESNRIQLHPILSSGVYIARLSGGGQSRSVKFFW